jgi:hypothetical protein
MNFTEDDIDLYCKGELSKEHALLLTEAMKQDKQLAQEVQLRLAVIQGLQKINRAELKTTLTGYQQELHQHKTNRLQFMLRMAAVLIPLAIALAWYFYTPEQADFFAEHYAYYPNYEITITRGDIDTTTRAKAFIAYSNKNFEQAITGFNNNLKSDSLDNASQFYRGLAYLEQKNYAAGLTDLERTMQSSSRYATTANWYAALTALKLNDNDKAITYFARLSEEENSYQDKSRRILKKLKRP